MPPDSQSGLYQPQVESPELQIPKVADTIPSVTRSPSGRAFFHCSNASSYRGARQGDLGRSLLSPNPSEGGFRVVGCPKQVAVVSRRMLGTIEPEPSEAEREAIFAALASAAEPALGEWTQMALLEGAESDSDP